ncbi:hypothetical protein MTR67_026184 [Solanum verrucosum]|uniref:Uncharacterized protein n=1 Tax=Solanum verrucosum TaxID=315347 RepID=A0AAF0TUK0_SOLVR|nr:hypothetical protein MTR67_026184 [Solanum verrucosum]
MSLYGSNASQLRKNDDIGNFHDANEDQFECAGAIRLPPTLGNAVFHVTITMLQIKGLFGGPLMGTLMTTSKTLWICVGRFVSRTSFKIQSNFVCYSNWGSNEVVDRTTKGFSYFLGGAHKGVLSKRDRDRDRDQCVPPQERQKPKEPRDYAGNFHTEDMLGHILNKVLKEMKYDVSSLNQNGHITFDIHYAARNKDGSDLSSFKSKTERGLPSDTLANPKNEA